MTRGAVVDAAAHDAELLLRIGRSLAAVERDRAHDFVQAWFHHWLCCRRSLIVTMSNNVTGTK